MVRMWAKMRDERRHGRRALAILDGWDGGETEEEAMKSFYAEFREEFEKVRDEISRMEAPPSWPYVMARAMGAAEIVEERRQARRQPQRRKGKR
jgi:hypothetical protein